MVLHGESDRLVPPGNGRLVAERIPGAKLVMIPHASHLFATDQPEASHNAILDFLNEQTGHKQINVPTPHESDRAGDSLSQKAAQS